MLTQDHLEAYDSVATSTMSKADPRAPVGWLSTQINAEGKRRRRGHHCNVAQRCIINVGAVAEGPPIAGEVDIWARWDADLQRRCRLVLGDVVGHGRCVGAVAAKRWVTEGDGKCCFYCRTVRERH